MNEILINIIGAIVTLVLIPLIGVAGDALIRFIREKVKSESLKRALSTATDIVKKSVQMVSQTYVDELKKNGDFTAEHQKEAFNKSATAATGLISNEVKQVITEVHNDFNKWLASQIEANVKDIK